MDDVRPPPAEPLEVDNVVHLVRASSHELQALLDTLPVCARCRRAGVLATMLSGKGKPNCRRCAARDRDARPLIHAPLVMRLARSLGLPAEDIDGDTPSGAEAHDGYPMRDGGRPR